MKLLVLVSLIIIALGIYVNKKIKEPPEKIVLDPLDNIWWGNEHVGQKDREELVQFQVNISNEVLDDLKYRLKLRRKLTPSLHGMIHEYGINPKLTEELIDFWLHKYNWRNRETYLNKYPQFKTQIQGLDIHFLHVKPNITVRNIRILPILLIHGWPTSFRDFHEMIPHFIEPKDGRDFVFEVIAPSLPGFGFSQSTNKTGLNAEHMATIFTKLMKRLGFEQYYIHCNDWGYVIGSSIAVYYKGQVSGLHTTLCLNLSPESWIKHLLRIILIPSYDNHKYDMDDLLRHLQELGYFIINVMKPDIMGYMFGQSPASLLAYITQMFMVGTNRKDYNLETFSLKEIIKFEDILDNVMIYWVTNSHTTALRIYAESVQEKLIRKGSQGAYVEVPVACTQMKYEIGPMPDTVIKDRYRKLIQINKYDFGGHFITYEEPSIISKDILEAVSKMELLNKYKN